MRRRVALHSRAGNPMRRSGASVGGWRLTRAFQRRREMLGDRHPTLHAGHRILLAELPFGGTPMRAVLLLSLVLPLSLAQAQGLQAQPPPFAQVIEREVPALMKEARIQGAAVGLIVGGKLVYAKGFGFADHAGKVPVTPDTVFAAASLAKPIASWVTMRLAEQGRVRLD